ncbi:MAG: hypothetical protein IT436_02610 [Phycisphaerales bacterium]|nr:hypothetical protein [Phycisphaerales bacterium]
MPTFPAHAKVNLALAVGPPEPPGSARPGWHRIASWMSCIDLADDLTLSRLPDGAASTHSITWAADAPRPTPIDWPSEKDLAIRAHRLLEQHTGRALPIAMQLAKRIPVGGGLGGGSSDAAAMLTGLNRLFELGIGVEELQSLGATLGSDVAFFIDDRWPARPAVVTGFGDRIRRTPAAAADLLLVIPPFSCPTAEIYAAYDRLPDGPDVRTLNEPMVRSLALSAAGPGPSLPGALFNTLLPAACRAQPALAGLVDRIAECLCTDTAAPARAHLSGSGSCLFIPLGRDHKPPEVAMKILAAAPGCAIRRTRLV